MPKTKEYLGDGLYADFDGFTVKVTSENGVAVLQEVFFEPGVLQALVNYARQQGIAIK